MLGDSKGRGDACWSDIADAEADVEDIGGVFDVREIH